MEKRWIWPFELEEQIGSGAMGVVYRARFVKNDRRVALKLLPADVAANATLAARFQREMELLKDLRHSHIVHCFGGTCEGDQWFYAMELIEGGTLASLIEEQGRIPWLKTIDFGLQIAAALGYAHDRDIIHRDLKPGNLLITKGGKLKLSDFGLAQVSAETKLTAAGKTVGSLHYMAPEQIQGKPPISHRTDLYAFGCVLHEMLTGRPPFTGGTVAEILQRHVRDAPPPVSGIALDCPPALEALVSELLAKDAARRPEDAHSVARRLQMIDRDVTVKTPRFDRNRPIAAAVTTETVSSEIPRVATRPSGWMMAGMLLAGLVLGWLVAWLAGGNSGPAVHQKELVAALRDPKADVRIFAAHALGEAGAQARDAVPKLIEALSDDNQLVRIEVINALVKTSTPEVAGPEFRKIQQRDVDPVVRSEAGDALKDLRQGAGAPPIGWILFGIVVLLGGGGGVWFWRQSAKEAESGGARSTGAR